MHSRPHQEGGLWQRGQQALAAQQAKDLCAGSKTTT
eukprot:CAMPEP_0195062132 /NCGR_PEP_ID=MMETSP0448-20130528/8836_1 /TAXON_ID=66468 /ORGANISM="Heterocapsa triquestra, Strain CCMP 448" /LENGTH=35 /DNA_ID= /DNA_START= /DNA_END= /DNA_ORIENTATION=